MDELNYIRVKDLWMDENCEVRPTQIIIPFKSNIGNYLNVNGIDIGQNIFPEEFKKILEGYNSVIHKLKDYKQTKKIMNDQKFNKC